MVFEIKKTQIFIKFLDRTQKSPASLQKKFGLGLEDFLPVFGKLTYPYVVFESKKTQILIEFLDCTQKSSASLQKKFG